MIIEIEKKECCRDLAAICVYDSSVVANEHGGELHSDLIKAHGTVIIVGSDHEVVKSRRVGK